MKPLLASGCPKVQKFSVYDLAGPGRPPAPVQNIPQPSSSWPGSRFRPGNQSSPDFTSGNGTPAVTCPRTLIQQAEVCGSIPCGTWLQNPRPAGLAPLNGLVPFTSFPFSQRRPDLQIFPITGGKFAENVSNLPKEEGGTNNPRLRAKIHRRQRD